MGTQMSSEAIFVRWQGRPTGLTQSSRGGTRVRNGRKPCTTHINAPQTLTESSRLTCLCRVLDTRMTGIRSRNYLYSLETKNRTETTSKHRKDPTISLLVGKYPIHYSYKYLSYYALDYPYISVQVYRWFVLCSPHCGW